MIRIYSFLIILSTLLLFGCFTVPGKDRIVTIDSVVDLGLTVHPLDRPIDRVEYIPADQCLKSKINYLNKCMINYSWGRGWNDKDY